MSEEGFNGAELAGQTVGRCRLVEFLGAGGMGYVYRAVHDTLGLPRAVKILPTPTGPSAASLVSRFEREAQQAAKIDHPNVVRVFDFGDEPGLYYIEMEFVSGHDLATEIAKRGSLPESEVLRIGIQTCRALSAAHAIQLIHRDVKPGNILLCDSGAAKIADFGLVKSLSEVSDLTNSGFLVGSPRFMAPEAWLGQHIGLRYDIYALGATLFCALSGKLPFCGTTAELMHHHLGTPPPDPRQVSSGISSRMAGIVKKCMSKSPEDRYPSAAALETDLLDALSSAKKRSAASTIIFKSPSPKKNIPTAKREPVGQGGKPGRAPTAKRADASGDSASAAALSRNKVFQPSRQCSAKQRSPSRKSQVSAPDHHYLVRLFRRPLFQGVCVLVLIVLLWLVNISQMEPKPNPGPKATPKTVVKKPPPVEEPPEIKPKPGEVHIPPGTAILGSSEEAHKNPLRTVHLNGVYVDKYEVTNKQYREFMDAIREDGDEAYAHPDQPKGKSHEPKDFGNSELKQPDCSVVGIDWFDAYAYAQWAGKRLPTADEWERAARGAKGLRYPWGSAKVVEGNVVRAQCQESQAKGKLVLKPGSIGHDLSPVGCYDMAGNVMEWTGTSDLSQGGYRVIKGGGYSVPKELCITFGQSWAPPSFRDLGIGFRCARDAP
jgi:eukaryotic-like serine/threonine-protein kinase